MKYIEQKIRHCKKCGRSTVHHRNNSRMGAFGWLLNIVLVIISGGLWLAAMLLGWLLSARLGGWSCSECK